MTNEHAGPLVPSSPILGRELARDDRDMAGPSQKLRSSGDLVVDRRLLYARAAAAEGDHVVAAEVLEQTLPLAPTWAPLWLVLAESLEKLGRRSDAVAAYERAEVLDSGGALGVPMQLARIGALPAPRGAPESYVRALFDDYADRFETHLTGALSYRGPELLRRALERLGATTFVKVIDLGCGTGLCGAEIRPMCQHLTGVDLSERMIDVARAKNNYDRLVVGSNADFLYSETAESTTLVLAADVLVYSGDLSPTFAAVRHVLAADGYFAFTLQRADSGTYRVGYDLRYAHAEPHIVEVAHDTGLQIVLLEEATTRTEAGQSVRGFVGVATRDDAILSIPARPRATS